MSLAPPLIKVSKKIIKQFGRTVTLNKTSSGEYNPDTGTSSTTASSTIYGFIGQYTTQELGNNALINAGDSPMYTTDAIDKSDSVTIGGINYAVTMVTVYGLNESSVLYISNLRRL